MRAFLVKRRYLEAKAKLERVMGRILACGGDGYVSSNPIGSNVSNNRDDCVDGMHTNKVKKRNNDDFILLYNRLNKIHSENKTKRILQFQND
jgi:hypothetical protein